MGNLIEGDERTNRDACVHYNLLPCDHDAMNWLKDNNIAYYKPDSSAKLWNSRGMDGSWETLKELGFEDKFVQVYLPSDYKLVESERDHRTYYLENADGLKMVGCWIKFVHYDFSVRSWVVREQPTKK